MKILIIGPAWVGDMVMAQSLFIALSQNHKDCEIDVLAPQWTFPLLERMPEVRRGITMPVGHGALGIGVRRRLAKSLMAENYDQAIVLPNSFKSALIPWFAKIPMRTGWRGEARGWLLNDCRRLNKKEYPLMVQRFLALAYPVKAALPEKLPKPKLRIDSSHINDLSLRFGISTEGSFLALCPGAEFGPSKQWPAEYFSEVSHRAVGAGQQVIILGSENDKAVGDEIISGMAEASRPKVNNLCGQTELSEAIDLLSIANAVVSNDSGLMHIAAALARPLVVIYGSTSPDFTPPLGDQVQVIQSDQHCSPCFERHCPLQHHDCMRKIRPEKIVSALSELTQ